MPTLVEQITELKKKRNAVILVHNYQSPEVQDIADFLGDSLDLSRKAAETDADVIVFCGVHFMAETAHLLSPQKTVLLPDSAAGCPMADMISPEQVRALKAAHPGAKVVSYVNTIAAVKAESDICCTSANAVKIVNSMPSDEIIFVPDKNLGRYVAERTDKKIILAQGFCHIHTRILSDNIIEAKRKYPSAEVISHPECSKDVADISDKILSTTGMCRYVKDCAAKEIIVATEVGIIHRMRKENPEKKFYPACEVAICPNMKKTTTEKVLWALESMKHAVTVDESISLKAKEAIERMLKNG